LTGGSAIGSDAPVCATAGGAPSESASPMAVPASRVEASRTGEVSEGGMEVPDRTFSLIMRMTLIIEVRKENMQLTFILILA
jgi:hypothetical protein